MPPKGLRQELDPIDEERVFNAARGVVGSAPDIISSGGENIAPTTETTDTIDYIHRTLADARNYKKIAEHEGNDPAMLEKSRRLFDKVDDNLENLMDKAQREREADRNAHA